MPFAARPWAMARQYPEKNPWAGGKSRLETNGNNFFGDGLCLQTAEKKRGGQFTFLNGRKKTLGHSLRL